MSKPTQQELQAFLSRLSKTEESGRIYIDLDLSKIDLGTLADEIRFSVGETKIDIVQSAHRNIGQITQSGHMNDGGIFQSFHFNSGKIFQNNHENKDSIYQSRHCNHRNVHQIDHKNTLYVYQGGHAEVKKVIQYNNESDTEEREE